MSSNLTEGHLTNEYRRNCSRQLSIFKIYHDIDICDKTLYLLKSIKSSKCLSKLYCDFTVAIDLHCCTRRAYWPKASVVYRRETNLM